MTVGMARLALYLPGSRSLKDKRMVLRRLKDRLRQRFNVAVAEVGDHDLWQRAAIGLSVVAGAGRFAGTMLDEAIRFVEGEAAVIGIERELQSFGGPVRSADLRHWEP